MKKLSKNLILSGYYSANKFLSDFPENVINIYFGKTVYENTRLKNLMGIATEIGLNFTILENKSLSKISNNSKHQGVVVEVRIPKFGLDDDFLNFISSVKSKACILILDSIQDPGNLGACIRSASAFGIDAILINKDRSAPINDHVFKSSVGEIFNLPIFYITNLNRGINILKNNGFWVAGLDGNALSSIYEENFHHKTALVLGSEGFGIKKLVLNSCDKTLRIPISSHTESLNVSVAAGIALYEVKKQLAE